MTITQAYRSIAELAQAKLPPKAQCFHRIFKIQSFEPACKATPELSQKYGVAIDNVQEVIAIQNLVTADLTWWNPARKTKPQNFKAADQGIIDPTGGGGPAACDFCGWETLTAEDTFGRVEGPYAVSASNLFKYGAPNQGVILFKHHNPLGFSAAQVADLLHVADGWFNKAAGANSASTLQPTQNSSNSSIKHSLHPLLVWNCLNRAGASQFHGHAQVMLSAVPLPTQTRENAAAVQYRTTYGDSADYYRDLEEAHAAVGLARKLVIGRDGSITWNGTGEVESEANVSSVAFASLCPTKDAEIVVQGRSLSCPAFQKLFYAALRALIDELGVQSFNAGIYNIPLEIYKRENGENSGPVVAKVVSRGQLSSAASDFGGLEVFAGASIGHTDPWRVVEALDLSLERL